MLAGLPFFEKAVELMDRYKEPEQFIGNTIQTNATLMTKEFAKFFKKHNFIVSVSLDGPEEIHDLHRTYKDKSGSFQKVMEGINILKEEGIQPAVIITVTKDGLAHCKETFDFIIKQGFKVLSSRTYDLGT